MTSLCVRPLAVTDREELASLVEEHLLALDPGLSLLDRRFPAGQVQVDLLALGTNERLVLFLIGSESDPAMLLQALEAYGWCRENGALLERLFPGSRIDTAASPRLYLLAPRFSDSLRRTARHLGPLSPVLVECRLLEVNGVSGVCLEPVEGDSEADTRPVGASGAAPPDHLRPSPTPPDAPAAPPASVEPEPAEEPGDPVRARAGQLVRHLERVSFREAFR